jgi:hypothetical protein
MVHIDWLNPDRINLLRINLRKDTFIDDIQCKKCEQFRLLESDGRTYIRYTLGRKIYWYLVYLHKTYKNIKGNHYYISVDYINNDSDKSLRNKLNYRYKIFNREYNINLILN